MIKKEGVFFQKKKRKKKGGHEKGWNVLLFIDCKLPLRLYLSVTYVTYARNVGNKSAIPAFRFDDDGRSANE